MTCEESKYSAIFYPNFSHSQHLERGSDTPKSALKGLGDPTVKLRTQAFSTFITEDAIEDLESFTYLARNYRFQGSSKSQLCELNSEVGFVLIRCPASPADDKLGRPSSGLRT